ncbi:MAG: TonB-dependent receptor, partial [Bacteroidota bacterium]
MNKHLIHFIFLLLILPSYGQETFTYIGRVVEGGSQQPLKGVVASIASLGITDTTNDEGIFQFNGLAKGRQELRLTLTGYRILHETITIDGRARYLHHFFLEILRFTLPEPIQIEASRNLDIQSPNTDVYTYDQHIFERASRSSAESLIGAHGVFVQKTNHGGGSPFIRGLTGNQTLLMIDGIRLNNATYRYGPNQYLNTIDPFTIDQIEVSRGSGSVAYGSDALGGVIHFHTQEPEFSPHHLQISTQGILKYGGAFEGGERYDMERTARAKFQMATPRVATILGVSYKDFGDLVAGEGLGPQTPSAYQELDIDFKSKFNLNKHQFTFAWQQVTQDSVGRYDQVTQLQAYDLYQFDPQVRNLIYMRYRLQVDKPWLQTLTVTPAFQRSTEERDKIRKGALIQTQERDEIQTQSFSVEATARPRTSWTIRSGVEAYYDQVFSELIAINDQGDSTLMRGLYPDGSSMWNIGIFTLHKYAFQKWQWEGGLRYNRVMIAAFDPLFGNLSIQPEAIVGHLRARYTLSENQFLFLSFNTGFRAPNINDLTSFGSFDFGIEVPNDNLNPERTTTGELGYKLSKKKIQLSVN